MSGEPLSRTERQAPGRGRGRFGADPQKEGTPMTEEIDRLADDYQDLLLRLEPTWAHLIGEYRYADAFEDVSRAAEDAGSAECRSFAARAEAIDEAGPGEQPRVTPGEDRWDGRGA